MICFIDPFSGISGDMLLAAFIDAGFPLKYLIKNLKLIINEKEFNIKANKKESFGIKGTIIKIKEYPLKNRNYENLNSLIKNSQLPEKIKKISLKILKNLATAESKIHNIPLKKVHFHEIGAIDTIIDIIGVSSAIEYFKIKKFYIAEIPVGSGEHEIEHGIYPNFAPATAFLLKQYNIKITQLPYEITTPTGAAIIKGLSAEQIINKNFIYEKIGYGFGHKEFQNRPNFLRIFIGKNVENIMSNSLIYEIEFNIDDMTGEEIGFFIEELSKLNILDIQCISSLTKKNRPSFIFKVLLEGLSFEIINFIFQNTTTGGIRIIQKKRLILNRKIHKNSDLRIKTFFSKNFDVLKEKIEFEDIKKIWKKLNKK